MLFKKKQNKPLYRHKMYFWFRQNQAMTLLTKKHANLE